MPARYRHPHPALIAQAVVDGFVTEGADLRLVTLDQFKLRFADTIRWTVEQFNATKTWPHRYNTSLRSVAV